MDLVALTNQAKELSDQQLAQSQQLGTIPPFIAVAEMSRRQQTRQDYQAQAARIPNKTIAQELQEKFSRPPMQAPGPQGPQGGPSQGGQQQGPQQQQGLGAVAQMMAQQPQQHMAGGGDVEQDDPVMPDGMDEDDDSPTPVAPSASIPVASSIPTASQGNRPALSVDEFKRLYPHQTLAQAMAELKPLMGADPMSPVAAELAQLYSQQRAMKPNNWQTLAQAGFAMAAAPTHSFGRALGEAGLSAIANQQMQKQLAQQQAMQLLQGRIGVAEHQASEQSRQQQLAAGLMRDQNAYSDTLANVLEASLRKQYDPEIERRAQAILAQNPTMDKNAAYVQAYKEKQTDTARYQAAAAAAKGRSTARAATPDAQLFNAQVAQLASKYNVENDVAALPPAAIKELQDSMHRSNPTEWGVLMQAAGGDASKAIKLAMQLTQSKKQNPSDTGVTVANTVKVTPDDIVRKYGGAPVR